jgi:antitoxin (DNA-binding transcriptional repressor) of toxin-antitoxin stability system
MTICDYHIVMKRVRIADLKARLSAHLRSVRGGEVITVLDRETPIARIVPHREAEPLLTVRSRRPGATLQSLRLPPPLRVDVDAVELLLEDRRRGR